jgi:hypothetical protein
MKHVKEGNRVNIKTELMDNSINKVITITHEGKKITGKVVFQQNKNDVTELQIEKL